MIDTPNASTNVQIGHVSSVQFEDRAYAELIELIRHDKLRYGDGSKVCHKYGIKPESKEYWRIMKRINRNVQFSVGTLDA